jgi:hypothetical protein
LLLELIEFLERIGSPSNAVEVGQQRTSAVVPGEANIVCQTQVSDRSCDLVGLILVDKRILKNGERRVLAA